MKITGDQWPFFADQLVFLTIAIVTFVLFCLQWFVEQYQHHKMDSSNVRWRLHRLGVVICFLGIIQNLDTWGIFELYDTLVPTVLTGEIAVLIVFGLVLLFEATLHVLYNSKMLEVPLWITIALYFSVISLFLVCNITFGLAIGLKHWWYVAYWLLYLATTFSILTLSYITYTIILLLELRAAEKAVNDRQGNLGKLRNSKHYDPWIILLKALAFLALCCIVVPFQYMEGVSRLAAKKDVRGSIKYNLGYDPTSRLFTFIQWGLIITLLWVAWIPLRFSHYERLAQAAPELRSSRRTASSSNVKSAVPSRTPSIDISSEAESGQHA